MYKNKSRNLFLSKQNLNKHIIKLNKLKMTDDMLFIYLPQHAICH